MRRSLYAPTRGQGGLLRQALALCVLATGAQAGTCRYTGTANHGATLAFAATATAGGDETRVDVTADVHARFLVWRVHYLIEEISVWRGQTLQTLGWNYRYLLGEAPKRQQWDVFRRTASGLEAYRIQGPAGTLEARHPGFGARWQPAAFGTPWLDAYDQARPDRRPDLDVADPDARPPMAELFHWAHAGPRAVRIQLPGFKRNKTAWVTTDGAGHATLSHPLLLDRPPAGIDATFDATGLARAAFHGAAPLGSVAGRLVREHCD